MQMPLVPPPSPIAPSGFSNCYVFKSRLHEYAHKVNLPTPVYETTKEGPSHEPTFRSTVTVNNVRYDSLPGFSNRKAAEQSAAEAALLSLVKNGELNDCISQPVYEIGLCKNLLQEYARMMKYSIPLYECRTVETRGRATSFSCTVEVGATRYIGAAARTKKEAAIKAARTALLAIQSGGASNAASGNLFGQTQTELTVLPCKLKRGPEAVSNILEEAAAAKPPKRKKARFKKAASRKKLSGSTFCHDKVSNVAPVETVDEACNNLDSQVKELYAVTDGNPSGSSSEAREVSAVGAMANDSNHMDRNRIEDCSDMGRSNQSGGRIQFAAAAAAAD